jgi:hypothetical protein
MILSAYEARSHLPDYTMQEICVLLRRNGESSGILAEKTMFLAQLCARGDIDAVKTFIAQTDSDELKQILNNKLFEMWHGTVLHMVTYWNTGNQAIDLFQLLVEHGADPVKDGYNTYPWSTEASLWLLPFGGEIGERNYMEFEDASQYLREIYEEQNETVVHQNASPLAAPILYEDEEDEDELVPRRLNFEDCGKSATMPAACQQRTGGDLSGKSPLTKMLSVNNPDGSINITALAMRLKYLSDSGKYNHVLPLEEEAEEEDEYADMPHLLNPDGSVYVEDEYADMPALVGDSDEEDEPVARRLNFDDSIHNINNECADDEEDYSDMPALIPWSTVQEGRLVYSDEDEFYDD